MSRTAVYSALVLRSRSSGESNSEVTLLTAEEGIIRATVFGGPKSKLRAHVAPYNTGRVWVYRDKAKDYAKLTDFDVHSWRAGLRELYERTMTAGAVAETILYSHGGGGDWDTALKLAVETLDALENANEELCARLLIHFLWRWSDFLGIQPHLEYCAACGKDSSDTPIWFNARENTVLCPSCAPHYPLPTNHFPLNLGCRRWLSATGTLEPAHLYRYSMDNKSFHEAKSLVTAVLSAALGKRLGSWDW
jgi:DNA repair protein RecO (recombination protein O)